MRQRAFALSVLALAIFSIPPGFALAQAPSAPQPAAAALESPIGKVVTLEGSATIERKAVVATLASAAATGPISAKIGDLVYTGDTVQTAASSKLGLVFADGTALNMLANARMELDEFVYQPDGKWNSSMFNAVRGTFTFIGGRMAKAGNLRVNTTAATLGIRGTTAHIIISEDGTVRFSTLVEEKQ